MVLFVTYLSARKWHLLPFRLTFPPWAMFIKLDLSPIPPKHLLSKRSRLFKAGSARNRTYAGLPITRSILHKLELALSHTITLAYHILLFQTMFLVAFYGLFWVGELTIKTLERRHSVLQFQSLSFLNSQSEVQATKLVISDQHNTTAPGFLFSIIIHRDSAVQFCPVEFLLRWCRKRRSNSGSHFCLADGSAVKTEIFTRQLKHGSPCFLWFRLYQFQIALFSYWCS